MLGRDTRRRALYLEAVLSALLILDAIAVRGESDSVPAGLRVSVLGRRDPDLTAAVSKAVEAAAGKLELEECQALFADFRDLRGKTLRENLDARQQSGVVYLKWLIFVNGADDLFCQQSRFPLATNPGDRVVRLCGAFKTTHKTDPGYAAALIIHEELHSLGLGENPPSSAEITRRVVERCGR